jgi:hypothetical protein
MLELWNRLAWMIKRDAQALLRRSPAVPPTAGVFIFAIQGQHRHTAIGA